MVSPTEKIIVAGDVSIDWLEIPVEVPAAGPHSGDLHNWQLQPGIRRIAQRGGALLLADLVKAATGATVITHDLNDLEKQPPEVVIHSIVELGKFASDDSKPVYRVQRMRGFAGPVRDTPTPLELTNNPAEADIIVLDDAANGYREAKDRWPKALEGGENKPIIIYKMSRPLARGSLWDLIVHNHSDRLVVIINANDLREDGVNISRRLSWERTAKDFVWQSKQQGFLRELKRTCNNLVVFFGVDGAILFTRRATSAGNKEEKFYLYYDPTVAEDDFRVNLPGDMLGATSAFVAALTAAAVNKRLEDLGAGIRRGILSSRRLFQQGFVEPESQAVAEAPQDKPSHKDKLVLGYPTNIFDAAHDHEAYIAEALIPVTSPILPVDYDPWSILNQMSGFLALENLAMNFVRYGKDSSLQDIPLGQFGKLKTVDRTEIESFRTIKNLMTEYLYNNHSKRPLSIAVFGPPGSGKSFGVTQIAKSIAPDTVESLTFNMAQFTELDDLVSAFHKVRNVTLRGKIPLVFSMSLTPISKASWGG